MRMKILLVLLVAVMVGAFAAAGQAAVLYADSVSGSGIGSPTAMLGKSDGDFATLEPGGVIYLTFGGYFLDKPTGADFAIYFSSPQSMEPLVNVSARNTNGAWVNLDLLGGAGYVRTYEIPGTGSASYDMISLTVPSYLNGFTGAAVGEGSLRRVPEPGTMALLGSGLIGLAAFGRKKFRRN